MCSRFHCCSKYLNRHGVRANIERISRVYSLWTCTKIIGHRLESTKTKLLLGSFKSVLSKSRRRVCLTKQIQFGSWRGTGDFFSWFLLSYQSVWFVMNFEFHVSFVDKLSLRFQFKSTIFVFKLKTIITWREIVTSFRFSSRNCTRWRWSFLNRLGWNFWNGFFAQSDTSFTEYM